MVTPERRFGIVSKWRIAAVITSYHARITRRQRDNRRVE